jgi:hypothetical protein
MTKLCVTQPISTVTPRRESRRAGHEVGQRLERAMSSDHDPITALQPRLCCFAHQRGTLDVTS